MGEEKKPEEKPATEEKTKKEEKKTEENVNKESYNDSNKEEKPQTPPPPPPEIVMRVYMHCEGCARKVRRCLKGFHGVEEVITDCKTQKVVVKGEKADALKVVDRVQKKTHRHVELLSPVPKPPPAPEDSIPAEKEAPKPQEIKQEPKVITVVLKVHMHCEACSLEIKKRIERMKEVEEAIPDIKSSEVSVKGTFDPQKLVEYVYKRTGKHATILKQDPPPEEKKGDDKEKDDKKDENGTDEDKKKKEEKSEKTEDGNGGTGDGNPEIINIGDEGALKGVDFKRNEYSYYYPRSYGMEMYASPYPPQIFSDENPNSCSIM